MKYLITLFLGTLLLSGCGADDNQIPPGASLSITPSEFTWEVEANYQVSPSGERVCIVNPEYYLDHFVTVSLTGNESSPVGKAKMVIDMSHTASTSSGFKPVVEVYDDANGNFMAEPEELVSGDDVGFYETRTDKYTGTVELIVRVYLSCDFEALLTATADSASAQATLEVIDVSVIDEDEDDADE